MSRPIAKIACFRFSRSRSCCSNRSALVSVAIVLPFQFCKCIRVAREHRVGLLPRNEWGSFRASPAVRNLFQASDLKLFFSSAAIIPSLSVLQPKKCSKRQERLSPKSFRSNNLGLNFCVRLACPFMELTCWYETLYVERRERGLGGMSRKGLRCVFEQLPGRTPKLTTAILSAS